VGTGGFARYSTGSVDLADPLTDKTVTLKNGVFEAVGGLRLRFWERCGPTPLQRRRSGV
jgi:hypothetical protein